MLSRCAAVAITFCRQGASFACCEVGWVDCRCGVGLVVAQSYVLEFFEVLSVMRRGSLFVFVLQCANRLFSCGVRVSRQIVRFGRSQTSSLARLCCLRGMFVGAAIFAGSICALSRNARVGAEFRSGKCEFAHVMGDVVKVKSAFVLRAHVYHVPSVLSSTFSVFVVRVYLSIVAVSGPRLRTCASAAARASNYNGLGVLRALCL